jgi:predicted lipoprotein
MEDRARRQHPSVQGCSVTTAWRLCLTLLAAACLATGCTRVPGVYVAQKRAASATGGTAFNAATYADGIWSSKIVPTVAGKATDAATVLAAIKADPSGAGKQYGVPSGATYAFLIKGSGAVVGIDDQGGAGKLEVDLNADGKTDVLVAIGPVFVGTALRDAVGFITFNQFVNQVDYANAATALNAEVRTKVVDGLDAAATKGHAVTFAGAFQLLDPHNIVVTPVRLEVSG